MGPKTWIKWGVKCIFAPYKQESYIYALRVGSFCWWKNSSPYSIIHPTSQGGTPRRSISYGCFKRVAEIRPHKVPCHRDLPGGLKGFQWEDFLLMFCLFAVSKAFK